MADVVPFMRWWRHEEPVQTVWCHLLAPGRTRTLCGLRVHANPDEPRIVMREDGPAYRVRRLRGDEPDRFYTCRACRAVDAGHKRDCATWDVHPSIAAIDCWCRRG